MAGINRALPIALLLLLGWVGCARAQDGGALAAGGTPGFDQRLAASVFAAAFTFMAPRTLDPVAVPQLAIWGLRGISALDPDIVPVVHAGDITLMRAADGAADGAAGPAALGVFALPPADDVAGWGQLAASVSGRAYAASAALQRAGMQGVIASFFDEVFNHLDPYSRYVPPAAAAGDRERRGGSAGVGLVVAGRPAVVTAVAADGPAAQAGIRVGERVLAIGGEDGGAHGVADGGLEGPDGSVVTLQLRGRDGQPRAVRLVRRMQPADTVSAARDRALLVIRVSGFTASTAARIGSEIAAGLAVRPEPAGIVLDLRGNRGGLLRQAVAAANLLLTGGTIASTQGRDGDADHLWRADGPDIAEGLPVVVLVDGRSASAAEVLSAALADGGRAVVVGSATLGKGLVQTLTALPDGGELFVTWSRILAPAGWPLQSLGVMPQVCTSLGGDSQQAQLAALAGGVQTLATVLAAHRHARPDVPLAEVLTLRAACPAALGRDGDLDAARFLVDNPVAYATALAPM